VASRFPEVAVIRNEQNLGFARGNNIGARFAVERGCELILVLNNDTVVATDALGLLRAAANLPNVAVVNPLILDMKGGIWFSGARFNKWAGSVEHSHLAVPASAPIEIESATGCAMLVRAATVQEFGPFDERYFIYFEDADLSASIRARGQRILLQPAAVVKHLVSADSSRNAPSGFFYYLNARNRLLFTRRHLPTLFWALFATRFTLTFVLPRTVALLLLGRFKKARALARGYFDFFAGRFGAPRL
jgi:GT2 family glycosyltransferase